ncbi:hypothetical protein Fot_11912 [Forsythia ovata]|uniref:Uncharacterized protein n=1 Tax=Forsythia ovata TaxID=205694 RepID=A0ABD1WLF4_9LAMI
MGKDFKLSIFSKLSMTEFNVSFGFISEEYASSDEYLHSACDYSENFEPVSLYKALSTSNYYDPTFVVVIGGNTLSHLVFERSKKYTLILDNEFGFCNFLLQNFFDRKNSKTMEKELARRLLEANLREEISVLGKEMLVVVVCVGNRVLMETQVESG